MPADFRLGVRVYYEDTDAGGVVYYANYLRYAERARTEIVRSLGFSQAALARDEGIAFAVRSFEAEYLRPAQLDDELTIVSTIDHVGGARVELTQRIERGGETIFVANVRVVCLDLRRMKAAPIPQAIRDGFLRLASAV